MKGYWEQKFWDLYDRDYETGMALEGIMDENDISITIHDDGTFELAPDEYELVVRAFNAKPNHPCSDDEILAKMEELLSKEFEVTSFEDAGLLTLNKGLILTKGGKEYQFELLGSYR